MVSFGISVDFFNIQYISKTSILVPFFFLRGREGFLQSFNYINEKTNL